MSQQMKASDLQLVKAIPGNDKCCDCGMKHPQWASVSFGNVFCLECSGVHRSLGVHISFVRSIAMDSWTPAQIEIMKAGGNDTCNQFLYSRGVPRNASIREKYSSDAAALYKQVLKARAEKRPEPTELIVVTEPKKKDVNVVVVGRNTHTTTTATTGTTLATASNRQDPNGMERLHGETDAEYIARQTRLREEAKKRMAQKFGTMDGSSNGKRIMGGIGSSPHPSSSSSSSFAPSSFMDVSSLTNTLSSGLGTAASGLSSVFSFASNTVNNSGAREVAKDVGNMGLELWSTISSSAKEVASNLNMEVGIGSRMGGGHDGTTANDGLSALSEKMKMEKLARGTSSRTFTGFGSDTVMSGNNGASVVGVATSSSNSTSASNSTSNSSTTTRVDQNSVAPLPGESDGDYMTRQMRIRQEAQAKSMMANNNMVKVAPAPPSLSKTTTTTTVQEPQKASSSLSSSKAKKLQLDSDDDFFASFGA